MIPIHLLKNTRGNVESKILVLGDIWGTGLGPFSGPSGLEFTRILADAHILETNLLFASVINSSGTDTKKFFFQTKDPNRGKLYKNTYPKPQLLSDLSKLEELITTLNPRLIIASGNLAFWALTNFNLISTFEGYKLPSGISKYRGSALYSREINGKTYPLLPIYSPNQILKAWDLRFITVHDLKARAKPLINSTNQDLWKEPKTNFIPNPEYPLAVETLNTWLTYVEQNELWLAVDIETWKQKEIVCIGFADDKLAICIPFFFFAPSGEVINFYTEIQEIKLIQLIQKLLSHPNIRIIGQNYNYDYQYLDRYWAIRTPVSWDTMLAHHLMWPGTPKSLDYLSSLYCQYYSYWKDESQEWTDGINHRDLWLYNCKDTRNTYDIAQEQKVLISQLNLTEQYQSQLDQWQLAAKMTHYGVNFNKESRAKINQELQEIASDLEHYLLTSMPPDLRYTSTKGCWFNSPIKTSEIFYTYLQIQPVLHKKTKRPTVDASSFEPLKKRAPWLKGVITRLELLRSIQVFRSHFLDAKLSYDKRIRCSFNVGGTDTFRWSSNSSSFDEGTNLQNIPKGD